MFAYHVANPSEYGVVEFDADGAVLSIEEKPARPQEQLRGARPLLLRQRRGGHREAGSPQRPRRTGDHGSVHEAYLNQGRLTVSVLPRGTAWLDTGTFATLVQAAEFVRVIEERQGYKIGCPEEIAWRNGWVDSDGLARLAAPLVKSGYGNYLLGFWSVRSHKRADSLRTVHIRPLVVPDSFEITPRQHPDDRGTFLEWFKAEVFEQRDGSPVGTGDRPTARCPDVASLRGVHFSDVPPGQAKYVTCFVGQVLDVVVDLRVGSPTFAAVDAVLLDDQDRRAVYLAEGLGHAFLVLSDTATVAYLCSTPYSPAREHGLNPLDPDLDLPWPGEVTPVLSPKDADAPGLERATKDGLLPRYDDCRAWYRSDR